MSKGSRWLWVFVCFGVLVGTDGYLRAQPPPQFKADMQMSGGRNNMSGKIYLSSGKMRMEMAMPGQGRVQVMIADPAKSVVYMIMAEEKMYLEMRGGAMGPLAPPKVESMDPANPCANTGLTSCKKIGTETVNGYETEKWEFTQDGQKHTAWVSTKLRMPVKSVMANGPAVEFRNIVEGAQPANLFVVPDGYEKMDMGGMGDPGGLGGMMPGQ